MRVSFVPISLKTGMFFCALLNRQSFLYFPEAVLVDTTSISFPDGRNMHSPTNHINNILLSNMQFGKFYEPYMYSPFVIKNKTLFRINY